MSTNLYAIPNQTVKGDLRILAQAYADYINATEHDGSNEAVERAENDFLETCGTVLDNYVFVVDPDWL